MLLNCEVGEDLRVPWIARRSNQSILKEIVLNVYWMDSCWSWNSNTLVTWCEELTHLKRPWCWGKLKAGGEGDNREWDGWMASLTQWTWVCVGSGSWWWTGKPGMLQSMGLQSQTLLSDWSELNWSLRMEQRKYNEAKVIFSTNDAGAAWHSHTYTKESTCKRNLTTSQQLTQNRSFSWWPWCFLACSFITPVSASVITWFSLSVCLCPSFLLFIKISVIWTRAHPNPVWSHFKLITSAKTISPSKATFISTWG